MQYFFAFSIINFSSRFAVQLKIIENIPNFQKSYLSYKQYINALLLKTFKNINNYLSHFFCILNTNQN